MLRPSMATPGSRARDSAPAPLDALAARFRLRIARARRQLGWGLVLLGLVVCAHIARRGTGSFRLAGAALLLTAISALVFAVIHARRTLADRRRLLAATLLKAEPTIGARALRALSLVERAQRDNPGENGESPDLAHLLFHRVLSQAPRSRYSPFSPGLSRWARS